MRKRAQLRLSQAGCTAWGAGWGAGVKTRLKAGLLGRLDRRLKAGRRAVDVQVAKPVEGQV